MLPKIGIIYLTYPTANGQRDINRCLVSMEKLTYPKDRLELICVESKGKLPPIKPWFETEWMPKSGKELPRMHYIYNDDWIGFSGNNNLGFDKAVELGCDYVHLTNEDTDVAPDYLERAVARAEADPTIAQVQSLVLLGEQRGHVNTVGNSMHYLGFGYSKGYKWTKEEALRIIQSETPTNPRHEIGYASGAAVLCRVSTYQQLGGLFDEKFGSYHEDTDASLHAKLRGFRVVMEPSSIVYHYYEFAKAKINYYWMERNRYVLMFSYYKLWTLIVIAPVMFVMELAVILFSIKGSWFDMKWKFTKELFTKNFWKWIFARRKQLQSTRVINDRQLLRDAVSTIDFQEDAVQNPLLVYVGNPVLKLYWAIAKHLI